MSDAPQSFDATLSRLDEIVEAVSAEGISLDEALSLYEEAVGLGLAACDASEKDVLIPEEEPAGEGAGAAGEGAGEGVGAAEADTAAAAAESVANTAADTATEAIAANTATEAANDSMQESSF